MWQNEHIDLVMCLWLREYNLCSLSTNYKSSKFRIETILIPAKLYCKFTRWQQRAHTCIPPTCTLIRRLKEGDILYRMCAAQTTSLRIAEERMTISISKNKTAASQTSHLICVNSRNLEKIFIFSQNAKKRKSKGEKQEFKQTIHSVKQINTFHCAADINAYKNTRCSN